MHLSNDIGRDFQSLLRWFEEAIERNYHHSFLTPESGAALRKILFPANSEEIFITSSNIHGFNPSCPSRILAGLSRSQKLTEALKRSTSKEVGFVHLNFDLLAPGRETINEGGGDHIDFGVRDSTCIKVPIFAPFPFYPRQTRGVVDTKVLQDFSETPRRRAEAFLELTGALQPCPREYMEQGPMVTLAKKLGVFPPGHSVVKVSQWVSRVADALAWMNNHERDALRIFADKKPVARILPQECCNALNKYTSVHINRGDYDLKLTQVIDGMRTGTHTFTHQLFIFLHAAAGALHYGNIYNYRYENQAGNTKEINPHSRGFSPDLRNGCPINKWQIPANGASAERVAALASLDFLHYPDNDAYLSTVEQVSLTGVPASEKPFVVD